MVNLRSRVNNNSRGYLLIRHGSILFCQNILIPSCDPATLNQLWSSVIEINSLPLEHVHFRKIRPVLGIRDMLVRIRIWFHGSVPLSNGSRSDSFLQWLKECKKIIFCIFFLITFPWAHYLQSLIYCFKDKFCVEILYCKHYFSPLNTFMRKEKDPDLDPGGPKICGSGSTILDKTMFAASIFLNYNVCDCEPWQKF